MSEQNKYVKSGFFRIPVKYWSRHSAFKIFYQNIIYGLLIIIILMDTEFN